MREYWFFVHYTLGHVYNDFTVIHDCLLDNDMDMWIFITQVLYYWKNMFWPHFQATVVQHHNVIVKAK